MKRRLFIGGIPITVILLLIFLKATVFARQEQEPEFVLFYAENQKEDYPTTMGAYRFAKLVEEQTDGRIKILVLSGGEMGSEKEVIRQLMFGGIDFARVSLSQLSEYIPEMNVLQMPYLYASSEHMWKVLDGTIGDRFLDLIRNNGMIGLSWYDAGARSFYDSTRPITSLEDFKGIKIRVQESELMMDMVSALGATPVAISYERVYAAIERGEVEGAENNWPSYEAMGHYEVAKYYTEDEHTRVPEVQLCSEAFFHKLSAADQEIIISCAKESALYERELWKEREKEAKQAAIRHGVQVIELSQEEKERFQNAVTSVYEKYCGDCMDVIQEIIRIGQDMEESR